MTHVFRTPLIKLGPLAYGSRLWVYYGLETGITVLKNQDGSYTQVMTPTQDEIDAAVVAYRGGYEYEVSDDEWAALQAAGYGDGTYTPPDIPPPDDGGGDTGGGETPPPDTPPAINPFGVGFGATSLGGF